MSRKVAPRMLYISLDNKVLLDRIDQALESEFGPNNRKFSEWMLDAARLKLASQGEGPEVVAMRRAMADELKPLRVEVQALHAELSRLKAPHVALPSSEEAETDDPDVADFLNGIKF